MRLTELPEIARLSTPEKILLAEDLWDSIRSDESSVPILSAISRNWIEGIRRFTSHPGDLLSLEELQRRIQKRK